MTSPKNIDKMYELIKDKLKPEEKTFLEKIRQIAPETYKKFVKSKYEEYFQTHFNVYQQSQLEVEVEEENNENNEQRDIIDQIFYENKENGK